MIPEKDFLTSTCEEAVRSIEDVLSTAPGDRHQIVDFGECAIVRLRDCLIDLLRQADEPTEQGRLRAALDQANIALSLITGVEYPGAGIQEKPILEALVALKAIRL